VDSPVGERTGRLSVEGAGAGSGASGPDAPAAAQAARMAEADRLVQLAAVLAVGARAVWPAHAATQALHATLPAAVRERISLVADWREAPLAFDAAVLHGGPEAVLAAQAALAARPGPLVTLTALAPGEAAVPLERLVTERSLSLNTAAAGGNAGLMAIE
jgi:RHH-type proline utilization regulon transcriptional repressor/proline dehydrogenase/delta 1-pyrroline-5-carboxylate dehydrogenase